MCLSQKDWATTLSTPVNFTIFDVYLWCCHSICYHKPIGKRSGKIIVLLVLFGLAYNSALKYGFTGLRYASVLSQIRIAYFFAALIVIYSKTLKTRVFWLIGIFMKAI